MDVKDDIVYIGVMSKRPKHTETKLVRMSPELISEITEWRRRQDVLPSEAEAIRRLIELGLKSVRQSGERQLAEEQRQ